MEDRRIILSFDDGPAPVEALIKILTILRVNNIKAEFYVLGSEVEKNPNASKMIVDNGHKIQNHSWSHANLGSVSEQQVMLEVRKTQEIIKETTGVYATKIRPPYGAGGWPNNLDAELSKVANSLFLKIHNWDIGTEDWRKPQGIGATKFRMIREQLRLKKNKKQLNVLMHVQKETARSLQGFIDFLRESGFSFGRPLN